MGARSSAREAALQMLFAIDATGRLLTRPPVGDAIGWADAGPAPDCTALAAHAGRLFAVAPDGRLRARDIPHRTEGGPA